MTYTVPFNRPYLTGYELDYVSQAIENGDLSGDGLFTHRCCELLEERLDSHRVLLTPSCTAALEISMLLLDLAEGDEVILPSFTFVSSANAVVLAGGVPVFVDVDPGTLNLDPLQVASAITERTRAIMPVHYAGVGCDMDALMALARNHDLVVVEDAAQALNSFYDQKALGTIGNLGTFSFHQTKNFSCGEGGALCVNDESLIDRAEVIREKGTNRSRFLKGHVDKYTWVDRGSSYLQGELAAAFLYGQLGAMDVITQRRQQCYQTYKQQLTSLMEKGLLQLPVIPEHCQSNYHLFHILLPTPEQRDALLKHLNAMGIHAVFHYVPLHNSPAGIRFAGKEVSLPVTESISARLLRLPIYPNLESDLQQLVVDEIRSFLDS
ncbi:MAG: dTDP-4-amino-4,6-dideoxygalactose transaminase [Planctomycetaceae bacterium]|nr:dTDP-4-amino-4,6-dideoxygalactose transaminase [Planctomycetaceae bacterium]|tara:strand:+ start:901 stop:2040 length:1140 start_codon:yes stop_codon:yes gene_type:complete